MCWCLQHHRTRLTQLHPTPLSSPFFFPFFFFWIKGNNFFYTVCMGLFCLWHLWICIKQTKLEILASLPSRHWANNFNKCFTQDSVDPRLPCKSVRHWSQHSWRNQGCGFFHKRERNVLPGLSSLHYSGSSPAQHYLTSQKFDRACIWNCLKLASLVCLLTDNFLFLMITLRPYKNTHFTISGWPFYMLFFMNDMSFQSRWIWKHISIGQDCNVI